MSRLCGLVVLCLVSGGAMGADRGCFDMDRWDAILADVRTSASAAGVDADTIKDALRSPQFIPSIVRSDANQAEFKLTLDQYLGRMINQNRIATGRKMRDVYPTMLGRVESTYGVPAHVILAFWGLESNYGATKARHQLTDAFLTLMYEGRRETFFKKQLLALMKIASKNKLDITDIHGSWAGAMGHFQFIPTTLEQYGADGNGDGKIDIINSVGDAMFSAGNYLNKLGWDPAQRIVRRVVLPADFDVSLLDGKTKKDLADWAAMGVTNPDGTPIPLANMVAGLVADLNQDALTAAGTVVDDVQSQYGADADTDVAPRPVIVAYLTYPNFYRIKKWNNSNWYAIAVATLADELK
ncbi:MAG: lytic murein transglycosylase [Alphaproteobacteria bacterium]|nr:lytic murein transglycosylase [Alphaproteobacteria bacterium]